MSEATTEDPEAETEAETDAETDAETENGRSDEDHLEDIEDGSGCTEIWEQLSEQREDD